MSSNFVDATNDVTARPNHNLRNAKYAQMDYIEVTKVKKAEKMPLTLVFKAMQNREYAINLGRTTAVWFIQNFRSRSPFERCCITNNREIKKTHC